MQKLKKEKVLETLSDSLAFQKVAATAIYEDLKSEGKDTKPEECDCRLVSLRKTNQDGELETFAEVRWKMDGKLYYVDYDIQKEWVATVTTPEEEQKALDAFAGVIVNLSKFEDFVINKIGD